MVKKIKLCKNFVKEKLEPAFLTKQDWVINQFHDNGIRFKADLSLVCVFQCALIRANKLKSKTSWYFKTGKSEDRNLMKQGDGSQICSTKTVYWCHQTRYSRVCHRFRPTKQRWLILSDLWPLLNRVSFYMAVGVVAKIGKSLKLNNHSLVYQVKIVQICDTRYRWTDLSLVLSVNDHTSISFFKCC